MKHYKGLLEIKDDYTADDEDDSVMMMLFTTGGLGAMTEEEKTKLDLFYILKDDGMFRVLSNRIEAAGLPLSEMADPKLIVLLLDNAEGRFGNIVMWAYTIAVMRALKEDNSPVTIREALHYFPEGFPDMESKERAWDLQKGFVKGGACEKTWGDKPVDNGLDQPDWWQEIKEVILARNEVQEL